MPRRLTGKKGSATVDGYGEERTCMYFILKRKRDGLFEDGKVSSERIDAFGRGTRRRREHPGEISRGRRVRGSIHLIKVIVRKGGYWEERLVRFGSSQIEMLKRVD